MESIFIESGVFGVNVVESVLNGSNYVRSLKGLQLLKETLSRLQWVEFFKTDNNKDKNSDQLETVKRLREAISEKSKEASRGVVENFESSCDTLIQDFDKFIHAGCEDSETFQYWNTFLKLMSTLENLIRSDRDGDWPLQIQSIKDLLPLFAAFDSTNYLRWCSLYLEDMLRLPQTAPTVHKAFMDGKFAVKRTPGCFNAVGADMALEQTINRSQKSPSGIIGSTRKKQYVAK